MSDETKTEKTELSEQELDTVAGGNIGDGVEGVDVGLHKRPGGQRVIQVPSPGPAKPSTGL